MVELRGGGESVCGTRSSIVSATVPWANGFASGILCHRQRSVREYPEVGTAV
jgi:hypothetical protein